MTTTAECDCSTWALDDFRLGYPNGHHPRCPKQPPAPHAACGKTVTGGQLGVDHCRASYRGHTCNRVVHRDMHYCSCRYSWPMSAAELLAAHSPPPAGWADHVRHIEVDGVHRDYSGCLVCAGIRDVQRAAEEVKAEET